MQVKLKFSNLGKPYQLQVVGYADTAYASLGDGSSQGAYMILLWGDNRKIALVQKNWIEWPRVSWLWKLWPLVWL